MTRYADPRRCPDCGATIEPGAPSCPSCALSLRGETAQRLFTTLATADDLLRRLRAASPVPSSRPVPVPVRAAGAPGLPEAPRRGLRSASVPMILLGLGSICLLVAAVVFLAVTWSVLGVGGRTATLVVLTVLAGGVAAWSATRGLRSAAESLSVLALGLLTLDLLGADRAGWLGSLSGDDVTVLLGATLVVTAAAAALVARERTPVRLVGAELVSAAGSVLLLGGLVATEWLPVAPSLVLATLLAAGLTASAWRLRLRVAAGGAGIVTVGQWLSLVAYGVDRLLLHDADWGALWGSGEVWPLLAAAVLVATPALAPGLAQPARVALASLAQLLVLVAVLAPVRHLDETTVGLVIVAVLAMGSGTAYLLPRRWAGVTALSTGPAALGAAGLVVGGTLEAADRLAGLLVRMPPGAAGDRLPDLASAPAPWLVPLAVLALIGALAALRSVTSASPPAHAQVLADAAGAALAGSLVVALALYPVPLWLVVGSLVILTAGLLTRWLVADTWVSLVCAGCSLAVALVLSSHADRLAEATTLVLALAAALVHLRARAVAVAAVAGAALAAGVAAVVWTWAPLVADAEVPGVAVTALLALGVVVLCVPFAPPGWWAVPRRGAALLGTETGAALTGLVLTVTGVARAVPGDQAGWLAVYLTVAGAVTTMMSLLRRDRRVLGWPGGLLIAAASWVRLADLGVHSPEAYTVPTAVALVAVGLYRMRRDPGVRTTTALLPGLSLALVPSLLWALSDPSGPRPLLLGLTCLALVLAGVRLRWTAPLTIGAVVGAVLVLRLAAPYVGQAVPRWLLIGAAGAVLVALGATWERRLSQARSVADYVRRLR